MPDQHQHKHLWVSSARLSWHKCWLKFVEASSKNKVEPAQTPKSLALVASPIADSSHHAASANCKVLWIGSVFDIRGFRFDRHDRKWSHKVTPLSTGAQKGPPGAITKARCRQYFHGAGSDQWAPTTKVDIPTLHKDH